MTARYGIYTRIELAGFYRFTYWLQCVNGEYFWNGIKDNAAKMTYGESRSVMHKLIEEKQKQVYHIEEIRG